MHWFLAAAIASLALLHAGYDTSEGSEHATVALNWLETGHIGMASPPAPIFLQAPDGLHYPVHELGNILWMMPAAAAGLGLEQLFDRRMLTGNIRLAQAITGLLPIVYVALTAAGFWKLLEWGFGFGARTRLRAVVLLTFTTILLAYSRSLSDVVATGAWLVWGAAFAARASARGDVRSAALSGLCLGCAFITRVPSAVAIAPIFLAMIARARSERRIAMGAAALAASLPAAAVFLWFNDVRTGSPFMPAFLLPKYAFVQPGGGDLLTGVAGFLFSPGKSIFLFSPVLVFAVLGFPAMWRKRRIDALMVLGVFTLFLLVHGSLDDWHADWGWGPRYAVFVTPLLWLPAVFAIDRWDSRAALRKAGTILIAASIAVQFAAVAVNWHYQYQLMWHGGRLGGEMYWRADNQWTDALRAAIGNTGRTLGSNSPGPVVPGASERTVRASTGINVWWISALRAGMPAYAILPVVMAIAAFAIVAWRRVLASVRREDAGSGLDLGLPR